MPILDVVKSKSVLVLQHGANKGFSGVENHLFFDDRTRMLHGDACQSLINLAAEVKNA